MTMLTTLTLARKPARPQETRVAPRPHIRLEHPGLSCPIDQRVLPQIDGRGLEADELSRVNRARNRARSVYLCDCTPSDLDLAEHVGRMAAKDELTRVLRERTPRVTPVRIGQRQARWDAACQGWDAYEANSGLVGHPA